MNIIYFVFAFSSIINRSFRNVNCWYEYNLKKKFHFEKSNHLHSINLREIHTHVSISGHFTLYSYCYIQEFQLTFKFSEKTLRYPFYCKYLLKFYTISKAFNYIVTWGFSLSKSEV